MNLLEYENYFKNIVSNYEKIRGIYLIDMFEYDSFVNDLRGNKFQTPLIVLENYTTKTSGDFNNLHDSIQSALVILDKFDAKKLNKTEFLHNIEHLTKQLKLKMIKDSVSCKGAMNGLSINSLSYSKTNTIANLFQGYRLEFSLEHKDRTKLEI